MKRGKKAFKKQIIFIFFSIFCLLFVIISSSYASFVVKSNDYKRQLRTGYLKINYQNNSNILNINNIPLTDDEGNNTDMYSFSLNNNGTYDATYKIALKNNIEDYNNGYFAKYKLYQKNENSWQEIKSEIIDGNNISLINGTIKKNTTIEYGIKVWLRSTLKKDLAKKEINMSLDIYNAVKIDNRGLKEAILEDNVIKYNNISLDKELFDIKKSVINNKITGNLYANSYAFDEKTGVYSLINPFNSDNSSINTINAYTCNNDSDSCKTLYQVSKNLDTSSFVFESTRTPVSSKGLYLIDSVYTINGDNNYIKINNKLSRIMSIYSNGFIKLDNDQTIYNWDNLIVSGDGTINNPYTILEN